MIPNFNFYDVYGYFLPGFLLLTLIWLPFGFRGHWPKTELASALVAVTYSYIAGHILQTIARKVIPPKIRDLGGATRFPSDVLLDNENRTLPESMKSALRARVQACFDIDIHTDLGHEAVSRDTSISTERNSAFLLCRDLLIKAKTMTYSEQFQGMYTLMTGLTASLALGVAYFIGWGLGGWRIVITGFWLLAAVGVGIAALLFTIGLVVYICSKARKSQDNKGVDLTLEPLWVKVFGATALLAIAVMMMSTNSPWMSWLAMAVGLLGMICMLLPDKRHSGEHLSVTGAAVFLIFSMLPLGFILASGELTDHKHTPIHGQFVGAALASVVGVLTCYAGLKYFAQEYAKAILRAFSAYKEEEGLNVVSKS